jgi:hypothetical protein
MYNDTPQAMSFMKFFNRSAFTFQRGGSWKSMTPSFSSSLDTWEKNFLMLALSTISFFICVINRLAFTANTKFLGDILRQFSKVPAAGQHIK